MRALLFEIVIILVYLAEGNQEATWSNPPKNAKKISYSDLKGISLTVDNLKDDKVLFESSNLPQIPENSTFSYSFKKLYAEHRRLTVSLDDMIFLVEKELINETQAIMIWDSLIKNKTAALQQQEENKFAFLQYFGNLITNGKNFLGHFPIFLIFLSGYIILLFVYIYLGLTFYVKYAYWALNILSVIFLYNFYYLAQLMHNRLQSIIFASFIYNSLFFISTILGHSALCTMGLQNDVVKWQEMFDANLNFPGKAILSIYGTILGYIFAFQCNFFIAHFPFYASMLYLAYIVGKKAAPHFGPVFQPLGLFSISITGFIIFFYIYASGKDSFLPHPAFVEVVNQTIPIPLFNMETDFRYAGIIVSSLIILAGFPLYLIVQSLGLGRDYLAGKFSYKKVFEAIKGAQTKPTFSEDSSSKSLWLFSYGALTVLSMYLGFKLHVHFIVILAIFGLQSFNGIYAKEKGLTNTFFFYTSGFITVNAAFLLGQIEDQFAPQILGDYRDGYFIFFCEALIRMTLNYYAFAICSANIMSHEMGKITTFSDIFFFIIRYLSNYLFAIYLIIMARMEKSVLHSWFYSISAVVSFSRVLLYSSSKNDPWARLLISLSIYLSGLRICVLSTDLIIPFYFGIILMNFSLFITYTTFTHGLSLPISILCFGGLFSHALATKSPFMMAIVLVNVCGLFGTRIGETKNSMLKIFLTLIGINFLIIAFNSFSFDLYYRITEGVLNTVVPDFLSKFWQSMLNEKELVEQVLGENLINSFKEMF